MPSAALIWWRSEAQATLDQILSVHAAIGGVGPGRRYATAQVNNAYAVLLSSQFQKFCRDLHSQAAYKIAMTAPVAIRAIFLTRLTEGRKLDVGNPNPSHLGSDFGRFGLAFWDDVKSASAPNDARKSRLEELNLWRNAIGHHDFAKPHFRGRTAVRLYEVQAWRRACDGLATDFDLVLSRHLTILTGVVPW